MKYEEQRGDYKFYFDTDQMRAKDYTDYECVCGEKGRIRNDYIKQTYNCKHPRKYIGAQFGRWTILNYEKDKNGTVQYICQCSCENKTIRKKRLWSLQSGRSLSCGCKHYESMKKENRYIEHDDCYEMIIKHQSVYVDKDDYDKIKDFCWCINGSNYVIAWSPIDKKMISLARTIMDEHNHNVLIDHIDGNTFNNRKSNLRKTTCQENNMNQALSRNNTSGHKGVSWHKLNNCWIVHIGYKDKLIHLGYFNSKEDAINARESAEKKLYGEYMRKDAHKNET